MASRIHSSEVSRCHAWTAPCAVTLPLSRLRAQLNTTLPVRAFSPQISDNRQWTSDRLTPPFHRNHVVSLYPW
jgi:hypothetical protein